MLLTNTFFWMQKNEQYKRIFLSYKYIPTFKKLKDEFEPLLNLRRGSNMVCSI